MKWDSCPKIKLFYFSEWLAELRSFKEENRGNKNIAIFGACGYVGSYLTLYLRSAGYEVFAFDMDPKVPKIECTKMHSNSIEVDELQLFDIVIFPLTRTLSYFFVINLKSFNI